MIRVEEIMSRDVITVTPETSVRELVGILGEAGVSGCPVVGEGHTLRGVVSSTDVLLLARDLGQSTEAVAWGLAGLGVPREALDEGGELHAYHITPDGRYLDLGDHLRQVPDDVFLGYTVEDIMTPSPFCVGPSTTLPELARMLRDRRIHRAVVEDGGRLVGIVTTSDVLDAVARG